MELISHLHLSKSLPLATPGIGRPKMTAQMSLTLPKGYPSATGGLVLGCATDVDDGQGELQNDEGIGVIVPAPDDPENVARQEEPKTPFATVLLLRADEPRRENRDDHGRPL